ncbi:ABC transporter permease subunit [bacterium]|nr:MAG: ABC transporter permease subunit [bacterium]
MTPTSFRQMLRARTAARNGRPVPVPAGSATRVLGALRRAAPAIPLSLWTIGFILVPAVMMLVFSFWQFRDFQMIPTWNLSNYIEVLRDSAYTGVLVKTVWIAALTTICVVVAAYPMAYFLARFTSTWRTFLIILILVPFLTSSLIRNYAWIGVLGEHGVINSLLLQIGLIRHPLHMLYTTGAVVVAAAYLSLPFAILAIHSSLDRVGEDLHEAARDLGASASTVFRRITVPLTSSGVQVAVIFVFVPTLGLFITPELLGGGRGTMVGNLAVTLFEALDFPLGSALAFLVLVSALGVMAVFGRSADLGKVYAGGTGSMLAAGGARKPRRSILMSAYAVCVYAFLFMPIAMLVVFSFDASRAGVFPPTGFTLDWYRGLLNDSSMLHSIGTSLEVAAAASLGAVVIAAPAAYVVTRSRFIGGAMLRQLMIAALVVPPLLVGFGLLELFTAIHLQLSLATIIAGHITYVVPYAFLVIAAQQYGFDRRLEEAASDLGATWTGRFVRVVLPLMVPGIVAALLFAITLSLDEFVITFLVAGSTETLPLYVWSQLRTEVSPTVNAIGTVIVVGALLALLCMQIVQRRLSAKG